MKYKILTLVFLINLTISFGQNLPENCEYARKKYLEVNPDVKAAGVDPWQHYNVFGKNEGRKWYECNVQTDNFIKGTLSINDKSIRYITSVNNSTIDCITRKDGGKYGSGWSAEINTSAYFNDIVMFGGEFNRINGLSTSNNQYMPTGSILIIRNDSIFGFLDSKGKEFENFGIVYKIKIHNDKIYAATSVGLWMYENTKWEKLVVTKPGFVSNGVILKSKNFIRGECVCAPKIKDIEFYNDRLYCVMDCTGPNGTCFFYSALVEFDGKDFIYIDVINDILGKSNKHLSISSHNNYLFIASDTLLFRFDGLDIKRTDKLLSKITLCSNGPNLYGFKINDETKSGIFYTINSDTAIASYFEGLKLNINKITVYNDEIYFTPNLIYNLSNGEATYLHKFIAGKIIKSELINCHTCVLVYQKQKRFQIYHNTKKCDNIENEINFPQASLNTEINNPMEIPEGKEDARKSDKTTVELAIEGLTVSEKKEFYRLIKSNGDPQNKVGKICGTKYSDCKWCGKKIAYYRKWQSSIEALQNLNNPFYRGYNSLVIWLSSALSGADPVIETRKAIRELMIEVKSGKIYSCGESGLPPSYCSKKCEFENSMYRR